MDPVSRVDVEKAIELATQITIAAVSSGQTNWPDAEKGKSASEYLESIFTKIRELQEF